MNEHTIISTNTEKLEEQIWKILEEVNDPEVPVLSVSDLGIIRNVEIIDSNSKNESIRITITPTYTGCPAMDVIKMNIRFALIQHGFNNIEIKTILSPAWTTDWMSEAGKAKLKNYGIAPPLAKQVVCEPALFQEEEAIECPHCNSYHTRLISRFGSTACKALYQCEDCLEPFDYFKCH